MVRMVGLTIKLNYFLNKYTLSNKKSKKNENNQIVFREASESRC